MWEMLFGISEKIKDICNFGKTPSSLLPDGFFDKQQSLLLLEVVAKEWPKKEIVGEFPRRGLRFKVGPIFMEVYVCTDEPIITDFDHPRLICWQPLTRTEKPRGWRMDWLYLSSQYGMVESLGANYWEAWSNHAKRHRQKWLHDASSEIVETDWETFSVAYNQTHKVGKFLRASFLKTLRLHLNYHSEDVRLFVGRRKDSQEIVGGLAVINYPDISQSTHAISFINQKGLKTSVGTGLIDYWYNDCLKRKIRFLNFGLVWKKGDPNGWRGYSQFKKQFALTLLPYRYQFIKFVGGRRVDKMPKMC